MDIGERRVLRDDGLGSARKAAKRGGKDKSGQLIMIDAIAERDSAWFVFTNGLQHFAKGRIDHSINDEKAEKEDREHSIVERPWIGEGNKAEERPLRHALDSVFTMGERRFDAEEIDHLRKRERDHRKIYALPADRQYARHEAQRRRAGNAKENAKLGRQAPDSRCMGAEIAGRPEEHCMTEGEKPDIADEKIESAGEERETQRLHHEKRVDDERRKDEEPGHNDESDGFVARGMAGLRCFGRHGGRAETHGALPKRPAGLIRSTIAMITKTTVFEASG